MAVVRVTSPTETRNPRTYDIDRLSTLEVLRLINDEDHRVPGAVRAVLPRLAVAVDLAVEALRGGGRVHYVGAGTSGRLAVMDAAELPPTFAAPADWFVTHVAGGPSSLLQAIENAEDNEEAGSAEMEASVKAGDIVVGLAASGRTPFVAAALRTARRLGASTALITANPGTPVGAEVDVFLAFDTGPEVVAGSTRMKAGTAQKLVLNAFSTAVMVRLGRTYSNLMVDMVATNAKLRGRTLAILAEATGLDEDTGARVLTEAGGELKTAIVSVLAGVDPSDARSALETSEGHVHAALTALGVASNAQREREAQ
ncbi:N-acetylmuramic acid 6-phosphate etherase [Tenggerimyces flavus]|uniref:N-acetylmuramic acid 6-phosphate etherase n=1 Tax=Tenggerimyces flavus TaxID=1708749 RepID=A0ABV7YMC4_9ACTN|nr:N-acetylmuramic acid 6-phosphate etherase [Tenggerimyces flavus]MBM7786238.1 N-acetylmuramic acid 6-phosphate etherase [Tenggerimyces flavus]